MIRKELLALGLVAGLASPSFGALVVTNGDFDDVGVDGAPDSLGTQDDADVFGWFDGANGTLYYQDTWHIDRAHPAGFGVDPYVNFSGNVTTSWLYQSIGTKEAADGSLQVTVDLGASDQPQEGTVTISLYQSASFVGIDGTDIEGASGVR